MWGRICIMVGVLMILPIISNVDVCDSEYNYTNCSRYHNYDMMEEGDSYSYDGQYWMRGVKTNIRPYSDELPLIGSNIMITTSNTLYYVLGDTSYYVNNLEKWTYTIQNSQSFLSYIINGTSDSVELEVPDWIFGINSTGAYCFYRSTPSLSVYVNNSSQIYSAIWMSELQNMLMSSNGDTVKIGNTHIGTAHFNSYTYADGIIGIPLNEYELIVNESIIHPRVFIVPKNPVYKNSYRNVCTYGPFTEMTIGDTYCWDGSHYYYNGAMIKRQIASTKAGELENVVKSDKFVILEDRIHFSGNNGQVYISKPTSWKISMNKDNVQLQYFLDSKSYLQVYSNVSWIFIATDFGEWGEAIYTRCSKIYVNSLEQIYTCSPDSAGWLVSNGNNVYRNECLIENSVLVDMNEVDSGVYQINVSPTEGSYTLDYVSGSFKPRVFIVPLVVSTIEPSDCLKDDILTIENSKKLTVICACIILVAILGFIIVKRN